MDNEPWVSDIPAMYHDLDTHIDLQCVDAICNPQKDLEVNKQHGTSAIPKSEPSRKKPRKIDDTEATHDHDNDAEHDCKALNNRDGQGCDGAYDMGRIMTMTSNG